MLKLSNIKFRTRKNSDLHLNHKVTTLHIIEGHK